MQSAKTDYLTTNNDFINVTLNEDTILQPFSEYLVECNINPNDRYCSCDDFIFTPYNDKLSERFVLAATGVVKPIKGLIPVRVINLSGDNVKLYKMTKLGFLERAKEIKNDKQKLRRIQEQADCVDNNGHLKDIIDKVKSNKNLSRQQISEVVALLNNYSELFSKNKMDIGLTKIVEHEIYVNDMKPIHIPYRRVPIGMETKVDDMVDDLLGKNIIRPSNSAWNSPIVLVKKKNGDMRMCIDFRALNSVTKRISYPIPETKHLLDCLSGSSFFSSLDLSSAYYQCQISEQHKEFTAFSTRRGHFEFNRMPFGLTGAPFTFQRMMHLLLNAENWEQCVIYLDDVLVFAKSFDEHLKRLRCIFEKLRCGGIKLSPNKCDLLQSELTFLGHVISEKGISPDSKKIECIKQWKRPCTIEEMRSFLGFANYYRRFIRAYAVLAAPLEDMMKSSCQGNINLQKKFQLQWTTESEKCFEELKLALISSPILGYPTEKGTYVLDCDASHDCIGAVLSQRQREGEVVISYCSKKMSKSEKGYCITRKELLSVYYFVKQLRHYLLGRPFVIRTDHKALTWLLNWDRPNTSQYCSWIAELEIYDFIIEHRRGAEHQNADFLSRIQSCGQCEIKHPDPRKKRNTKIIAEDKYCSSEIIRPLSNEEMSREIKNDVLDSIHRQLGHIGYTKMLNFMRDRYTWKGLTDDVKNHIANCIPCAERKSSGNILGVKRLSIVAERPFQKVMIDVCGPLPKSQKGYQYILGLVDVFSRYVMMIPMKETTTATIVDAIMSRWISNFGCPEEIISDGGPNLNSALMVEFCNMFGVRKKKISPYYPQANGIIEREFRTVKDMIYATCKTSGRDWAHVIPHIEMGLRATVNKSTKAIPYEVIFGQSFPIPRIKNNVCFKNELIDSITSYRSYVQKMINSQQQEKIMQNSVSGNRRFAVGDAVMVRRVGNNKPGILDAKYFGPCKIIQACGHLSYKLNYKGKEFIRNQFHLKRFSGGVRGKSDVRRNVDNCHQSKILYPQRQKKAVHRYGVN